MEALQVNNGGRSRERRRRRVAIHNIVLTHISPAVGQKSPDPNRSHPELDEQPRGGDAVTGAAFRCWRDWWWSPLIGIAVGSETAGIRPSPFQYLIRWYDNPTLDR